MKKAIVIGAGIGGLSVAARLLAQGFKIEIYEKNPTVGGKTNFLKAGHFKFDLTASILMFPDNYTDVFSYCGKNYKDYFSLIPLNKLYSVFYSDDSKFDFYSDLPKLSKAIKELTNYSFNDQYGFFKFIFSNYEKYLIAEETILNSNFLNKSRLFSKLTLPEAIKIKPFSTCFEDVNKYIKNEKLINYLLFQSMYVGISPYISPSIYNLIPSTSQILGLYHIEGGMYSYVTALKKLILEQGGVINTLCPVQEIVFNGNKAIGIKVDNEIIYSDIVICSSDYSYSIQNLIKTPLISHHIKPTEELSYSCSVFMIYLGVNKKYANLNIHNIFINDFFKENLEAPFIGQLPQLPSLYIYCPSSIDNTVCPVGCETINIMVRVPNLLHSSINWNAETIYYFKRKILTTLTKINGLEDIVSHIVYHKILTPLDLQNKFNTYGGCAFGLGHELKQSVVFRPQCEIPKIKNLYFTGASIHPGNGVAMVLKSSKICADRIRKYFKG